jgi:hypothetical protein
MENETVTPNAILTVLGYGLKVEGDEAHQAHVGLFFVPADAGAPTLKARYLPVNERRHLKAVVPPSLIIGTDYHLKIVTQTTVQRGGSLLKETRSVQSDFSLEAAAPALQAD